MFFLSESIEIDGQKVQKTSDHHKNMKYRMHPAQLGTQPIQNGAYRIGDAAGQQKQKSSVGECFIYQFCKRNNPPAHSDVADHGENSVFFQVNRGQRNGQSGQYPFKEKQSPSHIRGFVGDYTKHKGSIGAGNQKIDGAVIYDLHDLLAGAGPQAMIYTGHGVKGDQRNPVDYAGDDVCGIPGNCGLDDTQDKGNDTQCTADDMCDHIHNFFALCIVGEKAVTELCTFHYVCLPFRFSGLKNSISDRRTVPKRAFYHSTGGRFKSLLQVESEIS